MKLYREVEIDLDAERVRIKSAGYTHKQQEKLLQLIDLIEQGKFEEAVDFVRSKNSEVIIKYTSEEVWNIIFSTMMGIKFHIHKEKENENL